MKAFPIMMILILAAAVLSGCLAGEEAEDQRFVRTNPNLNAKIVDVKFDRENITAGEEVVADLVVANTGTEEITNETVELNAKVKSLDDFLGNLFLKTMSSKKKTRTFIINFSDEIDPGQNKALSALFHTQEKMEGRSLAGKYDITVFLFVNGQYADRETLELTLQKGTPRNVTFEPTPTPTPSPTPTPTPTLTPMLTPTPTPTPIPEIEVTPSGHSVRTRIYNEYFYAPTLDIDAGDTVEWDNWDDTTYTLIEKSNKVANITLRDAKTTPYTFTRTGDYVFHLFHLRLGNETPQEQIIKVRINATNAT